MGWKSTITNVGDALLGKWAGGGKLEICKAAAGTGTVDLVALMSQTALVSEKQEMEVVSTAKTDAGTKLKLRINAAPQTGYTLEQYGVWAKLDGGEETLLAIFQVDDKKKAIPIPSQSENPDFKYTTYALLRFDNTGELSVTINPSTSVTQEDMEAYVGGELKTKADQKSVDDALKTKADLVEGKVPEAQLPEMDYDPAGAAEAVRAALTAILNGKVDTAALTQALAAYVPTTRKVNNKPLTGDIALGAADVGARPSTWTPTAANVGAVPTTGGTFSGSIAVAYPNSLTVRHIEGANDSDLYLQYGHPTVPIRLGNGGHMISANGSQYSGNAATATTAGTCTGNAATATNATQHIAARNNPHGVSISQIGAAAASHTHPVAQVTGACQIQTGSYVGTGTYGASNPCRLTFAFVPKFVLIETATYLQEPKLWAYGAPKGEADYSSGWFNTLIWAGNTLSWYFEGTAQDEAGIQMNGTLNGKGRDYCWCAVG